MKQKYKKERGITLIALVITIIVLLILTGVSIATLTGDNGILKKANEAKYNTERAEIIEEARTDILENQLEKKGEQITEEELKAILEKYGELSEEEQEILDKTLTTKKGKYQIKVSEIYEGEFGKTILTAGDKVNKPEGADWDTENKVIPTSDGKGNTIPVPKGFKYKEGDIESGFVIIDEDGNEFVWIPCKYSEGDTVYGYVDNNLVVYNVEDSDGSKDNREQEWQVASEQYCYNEGTWYDSQPHEVGKSSIERYNGFYVGRYEAGIPENAPFYANSDENEYYNDKELVDIEHATEEQKGKDGKNTDQYMPISKKGVAVWNLISQRNAKTVSENMIEHENVKSYLIDSHAWNTIYRIIKKTDNEKLVNYLKYGNYFYNTTTEYEKINTLHAVHTWENGTLVFAKKYKKGIVSNAPKGDTNNNNRIELSTGSCEDFKAYNIYDLAGNVWEWTTEVGTKSLIEKSDKNPNCYDTDCPTDNYNVVMRGGAFSSQNNSSKPIFADAQLKDDQANIGSIGFRVVLYLK